MPVEEIRYNQCFCDYKGFHGGWVKCMSCNWFMHYSCTYGLITPTPSPLQKPSEASHLRCPWCRSVSKYEYFRKVRTFPFPTRKAVDFYRRCFSITRGYRYYEIDEFRKRIQRLASERAQRFRLTESLPDPSREQETFVEHQQEQPIEDSSDTEIDEAGSNEQDTQKQSREYSSESESDEAGIMNEQDHESPVNDNECSELIERLEKRISARHDEFKRLKKENDELKKENEKLQQEKQHFELLAASTKKQYSDYFEHLETKKHIVTTKVS